MPIPVLIGVLNYREGLDAMTPTVALIMSDIILNLEKITTRDDFLVADHDVQMLEIGCSFRYRRASI